MLLISGRLKPILLLTGKYAVLAVDLPLVGLSAVMKSEAEDGPEIRLACVACHELLVSVFDMDKIIKIAKRVAALDDNSEMDTKRRLELEKKNKEMLEKTKDELGKKMEDVVKEGVSGDDVTKAVGKLEKEFKDLERKTQIR